MGDMFLPKKQKEQFDWKLFSICRISPDTYGTELNHLLQKHLSKEEPNMTSHWDPHTGREKILFNIFSKGRWS